MRRVSAARAGVGDGAVSAVSATAGARTHPSSSVAPMQVMNMLRSVADLIAYLRAAPAFPRAC